MMRGTSSHVGKRILTTALCRIFRQEGRRVVPFKAQYMALNSYVTKDGLEMGRAQVAQAEAAGLEPFVDMNPVLLKPTGNSCSQVVLMGKPVGNMTAKEYHQGYSLKAFSAVKEALARLDAEYETVVIEGAGSPAEVNLKANDIVNMRVAKYLNAPVLLIADVDRGGALASLVGTLELLEEDERALVKGLVVNKFRGDISLFTPAVEFLEKKTGKPVLGVIPHIEEMGIDDEDSVSLEDKAERAEEKELNLAVIRTPKISNFTDFDSLESEPDVALRYVHEAAALGTPDLILLPGSKNTSEDMRWLEKTGLASKIREAHEKGTAVIGICGGYQMLGKRILDPHHTESSFDSTDGLGLLGLQTTFHENKLTSQVVASARDFPFLGKRISVDDIKGYEIHMGTTEFLCDRDSHPLCVKERRGEVCDAAEGTVNEEENIFGTYIHGFFDHDGLRRAILNALREKKGLPALAVMRNRYREKEESYDRLAAVVRAHLDMDKLREIMGEKVGC